MRNNLQTLVLKHDLIKYAANNGLKISQLDNVEFKAYDLEVCLHVTLEFIASQVSQGHHLEDILANETNWTGEQ
jgi:hypothetical protein